MSITDINGRVFIEASGTSTAGENSVQIETRFLPNGIYLVKLFSEGKQIIKKLIVMN
ncbi:MAG: T9SS type A sorting domain-containing protein [Bacteroidetes bacterium]|nr:T9SS type A sorting domain-containing protein [Bacteroidota bacterium]